MQAPIKISLIHTLMGLVTFVVFLVTGWYMKNNHVNLMPHAERMTYRAGHIYFLFSGLLNLSIGVQLQWSEVRWKRSIQFLGSVLLLISPMMLLYGFYQEASLGMADRRMTVSGIYFSLAGTCLHALVFLSGFIKKK